MEEKKLFVPTENQFSLSKVKLLKNGGLDVHYEVTEAIGNESYCNKYHVESAKDVHPDLQKLFDKLAIIIARVFNITSYLSIVESEEYKATKKQKELAREGADQMIDNIEPRGVSFSGSNENVGCVLTAVYTCAEGQKVAINTPRIRFESLTYGFEEDLEEICRQIEEETYAFLFKGKKAQLELFDGMDDLTILDDESETVDDKEQDAAD